jgi:hypothetical protein
MQLNNKQLTTGSCEKSTMLSPVCGGTGSDAVIHPLLEALHLTYTQYITMLALWNRMARPSVISGSVTS